MSMKIKHLVLERQNVHFLDMPLKSMISYLRKTSKVH